MRWCRSANSQVVAAVGVSTSKRGSFWWSFVAGFRGLVDRAFLELVVVIVSTTSNK